MPNWVTNRVTVYGEPEQLAKFRERAGAATLLDDEPVFSFWNFVRPSDDILDEYRGGENLPVGDKNQNSWYYWNSRNWGTKWDACHAEFIGSDTGGSIEYLFDTAWSPPEPVFQVMIAEFPQLRFSILYEEEQGWGGELTGMDGKLMIDRQWDIPEYEEATV